MKNSLRIALVAPFVLVACSRSKGDNKPLPTPMSLGNLATPTQAAAADATPASGGSAAMPANRPPVIESIEIQGAGGGAPGALHPNAKDTLKVVYKATDLDGDLISAKVRWLVMNRELGQGETLAPGSFKKNDTVTVEVVLTDSRGAATTRTMTAQIHNAPPEITSIPSGPLAGYHPVATDPDGDNVTIEMAPVPGFGFDGGTVTITDNAVAVTQKGKSLAITAKDSDGATTTQSIVINL